ncbi:UbiH/UbiF/VisC/COQ6 family ubiquinone biosynthesis hydroxylase [Arenibacterium halophilum]|uniref:2-octaprenyl-6-methoxyphenyl hydroxylase n=1 Tax=Arenibacterium halophilum TaxID=2583821 RepID=A0ABY2X4X9_9RHOB|nr:UbiH/UbiF/VisC/COQ6 family ubiquinone biosynthesis hydroxylase [Arenibacterium halophilum]TMV10506.1 2-octaprenyl-6-methoxyphenyl hydroxylase [Arenibacterium halophilum]
MADHSDILIVGGGLNGPALALALAQAGFSVTVIDAMVRDTRDDPGFDGRAYALALTSCRMLGAIGLWSDLRAHAEPMLKIAVSDGHAGAGPSPFAMQFDHAEIEEGPMGHVIEDRFLRRALMQALDDAPGVTQINGAQVVAQETTPGGVTAALADGRQLSGRVLVGADGRSSGTATRAGIRRTAWGYGQTALVCAVAHERPHEGVAHQFFMPSGPLAILPLPGNVSSIVWSEETPRAKALMQADDNAFLAALRPRFGDFLGEISLDGQRFSYPLGLSLAQRLVANRVALVGDAAHGLHPIAGQGLNAGFRDIAALAEVLAEAKRRGEDIGTAPVLDRYAQWRRFDTAALAMATDTFNRLFSNDNPLLRLGRDIGMGLVGAAPGLRRGFIREAAGLTGDLPRLMQGQPA